MLLLSACGGLSDAVRSGYSDLRLELSACGQPSPVAFDAVAVDRDLDLLERILTRGYAGHHLHEPASWEAAFGSEARRVLTSARTPVELVEGLAQNFAFLEDRHLGFSARVEENRHWRSTIPRRRAYVGSLRLRETEDGFADEGGRRFVRCDGPSVAESPAPFLEGDARIVHRPLALSVEEPPTTRCVLRGEDGDEEHELEWSPLELSDGPGPSFERRGGSPPWLRLRTLFPTRAGALEAFVASAAEVRDAPVVVLDLRGVGGGADRFLVRFFAELTSEPIAYWQTETLESEVTLQGAANFWGCARSGSTTDAGGDRWLDRRMTRVERELSRAAETRGLFRELTPRTRVTEGTAPSTFEGRLVLLVDRRCASACETAVMLGRQLPGTLVVGENTEGTMKVGELRAYRLPETGIWVTAGTRVHRHPTDGALFPEGLGYLPDFWLDGEDTEARVQALAAALSRSAR